MLAGCSTTQRARTPAVTSPTPVAGRLPTEDEVRVASAGYLRAVRARIVEVTFDGKSVGVYVRGEPEWSLDHFVDQLPVAAEAARGMLALWPEVADVDICGDGPWLPRDDYDDFATAARVRVFRDRLPRLPAAFTTPAQVIHEGGTTRSIDYYLDAKIVAESARYREAARGNLPNRTLVPSAPL